MQTVLFIAGERARSLLTPSYPEEAFQSTGSNFFSVEHVERARQDCCEPIAICEVTGDERKGKRALENVRIRKESNGRLKVEKKRDDASSYMCICNKQATVKWFWGGHYRGWLWLCNDDEGTMLTLGRCNKMRELQHALKNCGLADVCEQMADHMLAMNYPSEADDSTEAVGGPSADASGTAAGPGGETPGTGADNKQTRQ